MEFLTTIQGSVWGILLIIGLLLLVLLLGWWLMRYYQSPQRELDRLLRRSAHRVLADVVIPDGMDGHIHLDYLLLGPEGLQVVDSLNVQGVVFGAPRMDEWAVMQGHKRHSFRNPLYGLQDRVAAVKSLVAGMPVEGQVVFCRGVSFPKGVPEGTLEYQDLPTLEKNVVITDELAAAWQKIESAVYQSR